jgi:glycine cleavage system H protein
MNKIANPRVFSRFYNISKNIRLLHTSQKNFTVTYTKNDEWINYGQTDTKNNINIGLTESAVEQLGEIVYLDFPFDIEEKFEKDDDIVFIESVKATASIKAPFNGIVKNVNNNLEENFDILNKTPEVYDSSWLIKIDKLN